MIKINIKDYEYNLPEERIAQYPLEERDASRLLVYLGEKISCDIFKNIDEHIPTDSLLVFNNTRVIKARLLFKKETGAGIELFCLEPCQPSEYELSLSSKDPVVWKCLVGNIKKWKNGVLSTQFSYHDLVYKLNAEKLYSEGEAWFIRFGWNKNDLTFSEVLESAGHVPLPPYIEREDEANDYQRYQTVYSRISGSVAAPTAGLHFSEEVFRKLEKKGIKKTEVTLHIGAGTFQPVRTRDISKHNMHREYYSVSRGVIRNLVENRGRIITVGTTAVRTIESLYWNGVKILKNPSITEKDINVGQWEPYESDNHVPVDESLEALLNFMENRSISFLQSSTAMIIVPGYKFKMAAGLITNFHLPRSTLLLLISARVGPKWKTIYKYALENDFRFLSYGDSCLLL